MSSRFPLQARKEAATSAAKDEIIALALGLLITHQNASLSLNVTRKLTWPSSRNSNIFAPTAIQRNNFNRDADAKIVELGIEAGLWVNSSEAGRIGIKTIEEYIIGEEKKLIQERLRATSNMLIAMAERLGKCAINDFEQGFGSAGPGQPWVTAEDELKNALRAVQDYRKLEKNFGSDHNTGFLEGDMDDVQPEISQCNWNGDRRAWGAGSQFDGDEEYAGTWDQQDEKNSGMQNQAGWVNNDQANRTWSEPVAQDWDQHEQEPITPVNGCDQGWGDDDEVDCVDAVQHDGD